MKKYTLTLFLASIAIIALQSFMLGDNGLGKRRDGTEPGHTGSPGDSLKNCTICHGGTTTNVNGWIVSDIPAEGFEPGEKYAIKATNTYLGHTRFGFQVSPQDIKGNLLGTLVATDTVATQLVGNGKYITYRTGGVDGQDSRSWDFEWIAPADTINEVVFYGAFNSNHDGHKESDETFLTQMKVFKKGFTGLNDQQVFTQISIFPNPVSDILNIHFESKQQGITKIMLHPMNGAEVISLWNSHTSSNTFSQSFDLTKMAKGNYIVSVTHNQHTRTEKIIVK
jgi:hypothetical protein